MASRRHSANEIVTTLRNADSMLAQGRPLKEILLTVSVTPITYYRWRKQYHGLSIDHVERLLALQTENSRLRRMAAGLTLDKSILLSVVDTYLPTIALRRDSVAHVQAALGVSERRACRVLGQHRSTQRKRPKRRWR
ncbi:MAG: transposase [Alphaproteobacteria bacterium]